MTITINGATEIKLNERTTMIVLQVIEAQADIEGTPVGQFRVDFSGRSIKSSLTRVFRPRKVGPDDDPADKV